jgi:hypothetical protein
MSAGLMELFNIISGGGVPARAEDLAKGNDSNEWVYDLAFSIEISNFQ